MGSYAAPAKPPTMRSTPLPSQQETGERISAECYFTGDKHSNSRRAIGVGEYGQVPMCADCLEGYARARKPVDPNELECHGPYRAAHQEEDEADDR